MATPLLFFVINGVPYDLYPAAAGQNLSRPDADPSPGFQKYGNVISRPLTPTRFPRNGGEGEG